MKLSVVLSTHAAAFQAVAFKGDFEANVAKIAGWVMTVSNSPCGIQSW